VSKVTPILVPESSKVILIGIVFGKIIKLVVGIPIVTVVLSLPVVFQLHEVAGTMLKT